MSDFSILGQAIALSAFPIARAETRDNNAWLEGFYITIRLSDVVNAIRVHTNGRSFDGREASKLNGAWFAVGDIIQTSDEYRSSRSLPGFFTHVALVTLKPETVLNLGICSPLFSNTVGGGFQVEYVAGPFAEISASNFKWSSRWGNA